MTSRPHRSRRLALSNPPFRLARERYAALGVDVDHALKALAQIPVSLHCWQGDDVTGFETRPDQTLSHMGQSLVRDEPLGGGRAVTGNYPGKARTPAMYGEFGGKRVDRGEIEVAHFKNWIGWAKSHGLGLDFNPTCFAHPKAADGFTLSHRDKGTRQFWIEHCRRSREIGAAMGTALGPPCVTNVWIPDGFKDTPADRQSPRERLAAALDEVFKTPLPTKHNLDAVEPKLFGIGAESCTVGSHEFYLDYAITRRKLLCLDAGHFHPTESIADKISSVLLYVPEILLHALQEESKSLPFGAVWDFYCETKGVPVGEAWLAEVKAYEKSVSSKRDWIRG